MRGVARLSTCQRRRLPSSFLQPPSKNTTTSLRVEISRPYRKQLLLHGGPWRNPNGDLFMHWLQTRPRSAKRSSRPCGRINSSKRCSISSSSESLCERKRQPSDHAQSLDCTKDSSLILSQGAKDVYYKIEFLHVGHQRCFVDS